MDAAKLFPTAHLYLKFNPGELVVVVVVVVVVLVYLDIFQRTKSMPDRDVKRQSARPYRHL